MRIIFFHILIFGSVILGYDCYDDQWRSKTRKNNLFIKQT